MTELEEERISVLVPVLNEYQRLGPCLEGLLSQGEAVAEILVIDGGSSDGTQQLVSVYSQRDPRIQLVDASPIPPHWNGKSWGLQVGLLHASPACRWILTMDADVHPHSALAHTLLAQAYETGLPALSIATLQIIEGFGQGLLHPSLLTTLVYRFGIPGKIVRRVKDVQANGQCFLFLREVLEVCGGFSTARNSVCEDITVARAIVANGYPLAFYEAGELVTVRMYENWQETWRNWTRSLPMHDRFSGLNTLSGWLEVALVQALPIPMLLFLALLGIRGGWLFTLNSILALMRIGVLFGTARAYQQLPWSYWLSPFCDLPVALQLGINAIRRRYTWRGRTLIRGGCS
ncbi:MAG TPA: glycosyltransferase family 2 protein [Ktedonobacteraceae bacterium]|nr:glycosyltransferase family 2 protein [Ktedonobacteraceae bacterium]